MQIPEWKGADRRETVIKEMTKKIILLKEVIIVDILELYKIFRNIQ